MAGATSTADADGPWMKLEFDRSYFIHKITIYLMFKTNWYAGSGSTTYSTCCSSYDVKVSVYQGATEKVQCGTLNPGGPDQEDNISTFTCSGWGDTVLLHKVTGNMKIAEIVVTSSGMHF